MEGTTITFDLPVGYEDDTGTIHKTVTMRRVKNRDIIDLANDDRIKRFSRDKALEVSMTPDGGFSGINLGAAKQVEAAMYQMNAILYARVCMQVGDLGKDKINWNIFLDMTPHDMEVLEEKYEELNGTPVAKLDQDGKVTHPFAPSAN